MDTSTKPSYYFMDLRSFTGGIIHESVTKKEAWNIVTPGDPYDIRKYIILYSGQWLPNSQATRKSLWVRIWNLLFSSKQLKFRDSSKTYKSSSSNTNKTRGGILIGIPMKFRLRSSHKEYQIQMDKDPKLKNLRTS